MTFRGFGTGTERLSVLIFDQAILENELSMMLGRDRVRPIRFAPSLDLRHGRGAQWWRLASSLALSLQSPSSIASHPILNAQLSDVIMRGLLLAADHPLRNDLDAWTRPVSPRAVVMARDIIETRAHEPLTISQIAAEVGSSVRALQRGYRRHLDMSPHEHLSRVRMDRAHAMLKAGDPTATTVAEIAALCGFRHPGRFAAEYRKLYRVPPNITLRDG